MAKYTYLLFLLLFSTLFVLQPAVTLFAENKINNEKLNSLIASSAKGLANLDTENTLNRTKEVFKVYAKHLNEMGYTVEADDKFLDEKFNELKSSLQGLNLTEKDLKNITSAASLTLKDLFEFIGNNLSRSDKHFNKDGLQEDFLNRFLDYIEGGKEANQVSTPTTGLAAPITIAFSIVRALIGGVAGGGALGALLAAAILTAADFGVSLILMILGAIVAGTVLGILGLLVGAIIVALLFGIIGFIIPIIIALIIAVILGIAVTGIAYLLSAVLGALAGFFTGLADILGIINAALSAGLGVATVVIVFLISLIIAIPVGIILGGIGFIVGIPVGVFFGSLIGGIGGLIVGGVAGGAVGVIVAQLPFLPLIAFVGLFAFVLGTAAYMALGPIIGSTNDYLTPMAKSAYSIYMKYKDVEDAHIVNNIDNILEDVLGEAKRIFGPKLYNTIKALEIIVDTTDFTNASEIERAVDESFDVLETVVY